MAKLVLEIEEDFDFVLIGISSHAKDYRFAWALNNALGIELAKNNSLDILRKKQNTHSFFSLYSYTNVDAFVDYSLVANWSENKQLEQNNNSLFTAEHGNALTKSENDILVPELKAMDYFFIARGEVTKEDANEMVRKIKEIEMVLTAATIEVRQLKSKKNLIF